MSFQSVGHLRPHRRHEADAAMPDALACARRWPDRDRLMVVLVAVEQAG